MKKILLLAFIGICILAAIFDDPVKPPLQNKSTYTLITKDSAPKIETKKPDSAEIIKEIKANEKYFIKEYQNIWDSIVLFKKDGFPQYETYQSLLENVINSIAKRISDNPPNLLPKLEKLRLKLIDSKKYKEAVKNYLIYGQTIWESDITYPCEHYINQNANDPSSIDIIEKKIEGQSKKGWYVLVTYRGKNAFGGLVLQKSEFEVQFDAINKLYQVIRVVR